MKRIRAFTGIFALVVLTMVLTACGKSEFGLTENTEKKMTITAERADKDAFFMVGSLEVSDGEQIVITSNLEKGSIRVEIVGVAEEQNIDQIEVLPVSRTSQHEPSGGDNEIGREKNGMDQGPERMPCYREHGRDRDGTIHRPVAEDILSFQE